MDDQQTKYLLTTTSLQPGLEVYKGRKEGTMYWVKKPQCLLSKEKYVFCFSSKIEQLSHG